jgi:hypothetical protein
MPQVTQTNTALESMQESTNVSHPKHRFEAV